MSKLMSKPTKLWTCPKCSGEFSYSVNAIVQGCVGYATPVHEPCGEEFTAWIGRPRSKDAVAFWNSVATGLSDTKEDGRG